MCPPKATRPQKQEPMMVGKKMFNATGGKSKSESVVQGGKEASVYAVKEHP